MTTPVEQLSLKPTTASGVTTITGSTARALGDWKGEVINVKDFGATGNGVSNDTTAIQAAFDAAFGPSTAAHGLANPTLTKQVFFPPGNYVVQSSAVNVAISAVVQNTPELTLTYTVSSTSGLATNDLVYIQNCVCNGDVNGTRRITLGDKTGANTSTKFTTQTKPGWNSYTSGGTVTRPALQITYPYGAQLLGAGPYVTKITNTTTGGICLGTNGAKWMVIDSINFDATGAGSTALLIDKDGDPGASNGIQGIFGVSVYDCIFLNAEVGYNFGPTNYSQADTMTCYDCIFSGCGTGLMIGLWQNQNAININVIGGNFIGNTYGIYNVYGTIGVIAGVNFEVNSTFDIYRQSGGQDNMVVQGCSSESVNFLYANYSNPTIIGCNQRSLSNGVFVEVPTGASIIDCYSRYGVVKLQVGGTIKCSQFFRTDAIFADASWLFPVFIEQCSIGGTLYDYNNPMNSKFDRFTHIKGYFINSSAGTSYFVGQKYAQTSTGASGGGTVITDMRVGDLPPVAANLTKGTYVTVFDANATTIGTTVAGGGSNCVVVFNNGTNWRIAAN